MGPSELATVPPAHVTETYHARPRHSTRGSVIRITSSGPIPSAVISDRTSVTEHWHVVVAAFETCSEEKLVKRDSLLDEKQDISLSGSQLHRIATQERLECFTDAYPLPRKSKNKLLRYLRWNFFTMYRRIFAAVFIGNAVAIVVFLSQLRYHNTSILMYENAATAAAANFCIGILMRNEHVVNALFVVACSIPHSAPLWIRRQAAKVYSYGGLHSSCGVSGALWYIIFCGLLTSEFARSNSVETGLAITSGVILILLVFILIFAHPYLRMRYHDAFESIHRFAGWTVIAAFWVQTILLGLSASRVANKALGWILLRTPTFWFLLVITCCIVYPWTRLRRRKVDVERLSEHATRLHFNYRRMDTSFGIRTTDSPLKETHAFATIPNYDREPGFSCIVSNAGDWTKKIINNPPERLWVRGAPTLGVIRVSLMFRKVLVIATGSGIGPCLSILQAKPDYPMRVLWSAKSPEVTYGQKVMDSVFRADPDAIVVDTKKTGRGCLLDVAYSLFMESGAEAAVIISNPVVTKKVVYGLETRGIPVFGAIFDS
ncbi:hypothetical protein MBLNU459_g1545t1 [Dothideomycetes sp. NU459]